jgi:conjugal transfer pilus assembly protein TraL
MEKDYRIPRDLDAMPIIIFLEADEFVIFIIFVFLGMLLHYTFTAIFAAVIFLVTYHRIKKTRHKGFIFHLLYKAGLLSPKKLPPYHMKEFGG